MTNLRVALANIPRAATRDESVALAQKAIVDAARKEADIVCLPECYVPGYRTGAVEMEPPDSAFLERAWAAIAETAGRSNVAAIVGTERIVDGRPRITMLVVNRDGSIAGFQDKIQLDPSEESTFSPGVERRLFHVDDVPFGIAICHEGWRYPETVRATARGGAKIVFHPHYDEPAPGSFRPTDFLDPRNTFHEKAMLCRAAENTCYFASVNCAIEGSATTSAVIKPDGTVLAWQPYGVDGLLVADIDLSLATGLLASRCRT